jgi:multicomponent Na+:H+ antiporter subunit D
MMTGTLNLADMEVRIADVHRPGAGAGGGRFITVGLALKAAVFPLHVWLPNAYAYAPHAVTVFIAACSTKVALYVLLRFDFLVFQQQPGRPRPAVRHFHDAAGGGGILFGSAWPVRDQPEAAARPTPPSPRSAT